VLHTRVDGRFHRVTVLAEPQTFGKQVARADQQQPLGARERFRQALGLVEVSPPNFDAALREIRELLRRPRRCDDRPGFRLQQLLDDLPAEVAGGAGDEKRALGALRIPNVVRGSGPQFNARSRPSRINRPQRYELSDFRCTK
jgi:hypothetical protein